MYFITKKTSKTGKQFAEIARRRQECYAAQKELAAKLGFAQWRQSGWFLFGGISSCIFTEQPDLKVWKKVKGVDEWRPKLNTTAGNAINDQFNALPKVEKYELNVIVGYEEEWSSIGFCTNNDEYFGFEGFKDWNVKVPLDCKEVTSRKYNQLFNK